MNGLNVRVYNNKNARQCKEKAAQHKASSDEEMGELINSHTYPLSVLLLERDGNHHND